MSLNPEDQDLPNPNHTIDNDLDPTDVDNDEEDPTPDPPPRPTQPDTTKLQKLYKRLEKKEPIPLRVHDVIIKGNKRTKDSLIEALILGPFKSAESLQELLKAATIAEAKLKGLDVFDSVSIVLDAGPRELPGTSNVVVNLVESSSGLGFELGMFTKPGARSYSFDALLKLKNRFGYADLWDASASYAMGQATEIGAGVSLPRLKHWATPVFARASLLSQDWLKFSSYKEQALGLTLGLLSTKNHELAYNLMWRTLTDPSQMAGASVRRQLGHSLLSSLKYTYKVDKRNSPLRPTRGYAYSFTTLLAGLTPDNRSARFLRQEFDFRYALPLGFYRAALNLGISGGVMFPWGKGFMDRPSSLPDRFFIGGNSSPVCSLGGPNALWGFKSRGLGSTEPRRQTNKPDGDSDTPERDALGGDLAVSAFADLSFDLPLRILKEAGVHGHVFAAAGNLVKLTENECRNFNTRNFLQSFRTSIGCGIIIPTNLFRMEVNYCHIVRQFEHDHGKTGLQISFSAPL